MFSKYSKHTKIPVVALALTLLLTVLTSVLTISPSNSKAHLNLKNVKALPLTNLPSHSKIKTIPVSSSLTNGTSSPAVTPPSTPQTPITLSPKISFPTTQQAAINRAGYAGLGNGALIAGGGNNETVVTPPKVYLVFWGNQWGGLGANPYGLVQFSNDPSSEATYLELLMMDIGTAGETWSGVSTQYCSGAPRGATSCNSSEVHVPYPNGGVLAGIWYDNSSAAPGQASSGQIANEAAAASSHFGNTTSATNRSTQYIIVSPTGTHPDGFNTSSSNFCAWHSYGYSGNNSFAFTNLPYVNDMGGRCGEGSVNGYNGLVDGLSIVEGHEFAETLTDMNVGAGWIDSAGYEVGDKCAWVGLQNVHFANANFAMQSIWSNDTNSCLISHSIVTGASAQPFTLAASPNSGSVIPGNSLSTSLSTTTLIGADQNLSISVSGLPSGVTTTLSPSTLNASSPSTLWFNTTTSTTPGTYQVNIVASGSNGSQSTTFTLTVQATDFSVLLASASKTLYQGGAISVPVSINETGRTQSVALSISGLPSGVTASFATPSLAGPGNTTLTLSSSNGLAKGSYTINVIGTATSGRHSTPLTLQVVNNDFSLSLSPSSSTIYQSGTLPVLASIVDLGGAQTVSVGATGLPTGVTATYQTSSLSGTGVAEIDLSASATATPGNYTFQVVATGSTGTHSSTFSLTVGNMDFALNLSPVSGSIYQGATNVGISTVFIPNFGSVENISLTTTGLPSGLTASFDTPSTTSNNSAILTVTAAPGIAAGSYKFQIVGTGSTGTHSATFTATVLSSKFSLSLGSNSGTAPQGGSISTTITASLVSGFPENVALSLGVLPSRIGATFATNSIPTGGTATVLSVSVGGAVAPGTYTIPVTGTSGSMTTTIIYTLIVAKNDFTLSMSPSSSSLRPGASSSATLSSALLSGNIQGLSLSLSGAPTGVVATLSTSQISVGGNSTLMISVNSGASSGTYPITITATGPGSTHSIVYSLTVPAPPSPPSSTNTLTQGGTLNEGQGLTSPNGLWTAVLQTDGNFVIYQAAYGRWLAKWSDGVNNAYGTNRIVLQGDGNLVDYLSNGHVLWASNRMSSDPVYLTLQNDGNLVVYTTRGIPLWWTGT